jgi:hypothetical protein
MGIWWEVCGTALTLGLRGGGAEISEAERGGVPCRRTAGDRRSGASGLGAMLGCRVGEVENVRVAGDVEVHLRLG